MNPYGRVREDLARLAWHADLGQPRPVYELLRESQWWAPEALERFQVEALQKLLRVAASVPFYRAQLHAAGVRPENVDSLADLARIQPLEREDVQRLGTTGLTVPGAPGRPHVTSGATRQPVTVLWAPEAAAWFQANDRRFNDWLGVRLGERRVSLPNRPDALARRSRIAATTLNITLVPGRLITDRTVVRGVARSLSRRPAALVTGASCGLYVLARSFLDEDLDVRVRACWSGATRLLPHYREAIEAALGCSVHERYRSVEVGAIAYQCPEQRSFHIASESAVVEIVRDDGLPAPNRASWVTFS